MSVPRQVKVSVSNPHILGRIDAVRRYNLYEFWMAVQVDACHSPKALGFLSLDFNHAYLVRISHRLEGRLVLPYSTYSATIISFLAISTFWS